MQDRNNTNKRRNVLKINLLVNLQKKKNKRTMKLVYLPEIHSDKR